MGSSCSSDVLRRSMSAIDARVTEQVAVLLTEAAILPALHRHTRIATPAGAIGPARLPSQREWCWAVRVVSARGFCGPRGHADDAGATRVGVPLPGRGTRAGRGTDLP